MNEEEFGFLSKKKSKPVKNKYSNKYFFISHAFYNQKTELFRHRLQEIYNFILTEVSTYDKLQIYKCIVYVFFVHDLTISGKPFGNSQLIP